MVKLLFLHCTYFTIHHLNDYAPKVFRSSEQQYIRTVLQWTVKFVIKNSIKGKNLVYMAKFALPKAPRKFFLVIIAILLKNFLELQKKNKSSKIVKNVIFEA